MYTLPIVAVQSSEHRRDLQFGDAVDVYLRLSRDPGHDELGVQRQRRECLELCERRGWQPATIHVDDDRSAFSGKPRPGYQEMLQRLEGGQVRGIVAWHPDRLHRSPVELERFISIVEASGAGVATVQGGDYDLSTASGRMAARIVGAVARHESEHKSERLRSKMAELRRDGKLTGGGKRPYGYEDDRLTIRPIEAEIIRELTRRALGGESLLSLVRDLNERGIPAGSGGPWQLASISRLLRSLRIAGLRDDGGGQEITAPWPAIITVRERQQLLALLARNSRFGVRSPRRYLLTGGLVRCGGCGAPMIGRNMAGRATYCCVTARGGCNKVFARAASVDEIVAAAVSAAMDGSGLAQRLEGLSGAHSDALLDAVGQQEERVREIEADYASGELERGEYRHLRAAARGKLDELTAAIKPNPRAALDYGDEPLAVAWPGLSLGRRRAVLDAVLEAVIVAPVGRRSGSRFNLDRVSLRWKV
jgi:site-specific DNA recombinase